MDLSELIPHIEALIFASDRPLTNADLTDLINGAFGFMEDKVQPEQIEAAVEGIVEKYRSEFYPFEMRESGGGWQFLTKPHFHKTVAQLNGEKFLKRLSGATLETLAIIAYKQPITKGEIESIRGVSSDYSVQKLLEKDLIIITGRNEKLPGHPLVYATSKNFMDYFGINSPEDLPKIREVFMQAVEPTIVNPLTGEAAADEPEPVLLEGTDAAGEVLAEVEDLMVDENGALVEAVTARAEAEGEGEGTEEKEEDKEEDKQENEEDREEGKDSAPLS